MKPSKRKRGVSARQEIRGDLSFSRYSQVPLDDGNEEEGDAHPDRENIENPLRAAPLHDDRSASAERCGESGSAMLQHDAQDEQEAQDNLHDSQK